MIRTFASALALMLIAGPALAQLGGATSPDPAAVLAASKAASGGAAWDALNTQHSKVSIHAGGLVGTAERWSEFATGRSYLAYTMGPVAGTAGYDGTLAWSQDASGESRVEVDDVARALAVNAAYRDRLAFWYPERSSARISYKERASADGADFDVIRITPDGGRPFDLWVNTETKLIERLVEREAVQTRTETYMDIRDVQGVKVPFRVRESRGDGTRDEIVVVDTMAFNQPQDGVSFAKPGPTKPDFVFPPGKAFVEIPFEIASGHVFLKASLNGKGPFRLLFDSRGANVLLPQIAGIVGAQIDGEPVASGAGESNANLRIARVERMEIGGIVLLRQPFATIDLDSIMRRVEGLDDVAGVIGYELLKRFPVKLDFERSRAVIYDPSTFKYAGTGAKVPILFRGAVALVPARVDGIDGLFRVDTGSRGSLTLAPSFAEAHGLAAKYEAKVDAVYGAGAGGLVWALMTRAKTLTLADFEIRDPVTALSRQASAAPADSDLAGTLGVGILRRFDITFDFPRSALYLEKGAGFGRPDIYDRAGAWIERAATGFDVVEVVAGGPAAVAGIRAGDVIIAIDGKAWTTLSLSNLRNELRGTPGRRIRLQLKGGAVRIVTLRDLV